MNVVKDKFDWVNTENKKLSYNIQKGRKKLNTESVDLRKGRSKK